MDQNEVTRSKFCSWCDDASTHRLEDWKAPGQLDYGCDPHTAEYRHLYTLVRPLKSATVSAFERYSESVFECYRQIVDQLKAQAVCTGCRGELTPTEVLSGLCQSCQDKDDAEQRERASDPLYS